MISLKRLVNCVVYVLSYFARPVFFLVGRLPHQVISFMANLRPAVRNDFESSDSENSPRPRPLQANYSSPKGNDSKSLYNVDSDSDESFTCEYDSTWDDEDNIEDDTNATSKTHTRKKKPEKQTQTWAWLRDGRNTRAAKDMQTYRHDYPDQGDPPSCQDFHPNLKFYKNEKNSQPDDLSILDFHNKWKGDYSRLERVHTFIQWLFPIREDGMNEEAYKLTKDEIKAFTEDETAKERLRRSYELMLDFYGIKLVDHQTGDVQRAENWKERYHNLNKYIHNSLRITRILKCLGTLGFANYQAPLVRFFLKETIENRELPNVKESVLDYFLFSILDKAKRKELVKEAFIMFQSSQGNEKSKTTFKWCPKWVQKKFQEELNRVEKGTNSLDFVKEIQPATEGNSCERNDSQLEEEKGLITKTQVHNNDDTSLGSASLESKHSDKDDETSANKGDGEKQHQNTEEAGDGMKAKNNISDKQENKSRPDGSNMGSESLESKRSDKDDATSASKGDGEEYKNSEVANDVQREENYKDTDEKSVDLSVENSKSGDDLSVATPSSTK
ncbi:hypothetical protein AALO_G00140240 [Alosa alosa]|uniref:Opioid growth factor receptor (OGFr) conserved domain-containing protein n=1 Tax=Alosa alosa TaxID=278164 RepID=A0AAV6GJ43_9TELE|nr:opioid growth factor receptor-like protein 1 [Alosa alosa]KAG5274799.1 hypothetical protein AALO_G00140240 [Alosa alosa]